MRPWYDYTSGEKEPAWAPHVYTTISWNFEHEEFWHHLLPHVVNIIQWQRKLV